MSISSNVEVLDKRTLIDPVDINTYEKQVGAPFIDSLTGLPNHGFFIMTLDRETKRSERFGSSISVGLINIDCFRLLNKSKGSVEGDRILRKVAECIQNSIRQVDLAARLYGDLFAVIFTESALENAVNAAERIRLNIEKTQNKMVTASIGLSGYPRHTKKPSSLLQEAYAALIKSKTKGKNCISYATETTNKVDTIAPNVLIVDDIPKNLKLLEGMLQPLRYHVLKADSGEAALDIMSKVDVDLVLLDVMMPGLDGFEVCRRIKNDPRLRIVPIILVTALDDSKSKIMGIEAGADDFISKPPNKAELIARTRSLIKLKQINSNLVDIENVLFSLARAVEAKDTYTQGHIERVSNLAMVLGRKLGLNEKELEALKYGGILHDVGKIAVPREILNKLGRLNEEEWEVMKSHSIVGYQICLPLEKNLGPALDVIRYHHEKMDGSGYPDHLKGKDIPVVARIVAVTDIYDAIITDRPYRKGMSRKEAIDILLKEAEDGKLDPEIVQLLVDHLTSK